MIIKKVLLLDTTLHKKDATGITLSNLFGSWPKESLFMIGSKEMIQLSNLEGYENTYILDDKDYYHRFPLGFFLRLLKSFSVKRNTTKSKATNEIISKAKTTLGSKIKSYLRHGFKKLFLSLGLDHLFFRQIISSELREWIKKSGPDYFYAVLSTRHSILFAEKVNIEFNKPLIIHIMDDWPATIGNNTIAPKYWNRKINTEFKRLLTLTEKKIAISQMMAEEYQIRFGGDWEYFHNPVVFSNWENFQKKHISLPKNILKIGYFGRIGKANEQSIKVFMDVVSSCQLAFPIEFHLYTNNITSNHSLKNVFFHSFLDNSLMPAAISSFNFLLLPISFNYEDVIFAKHSIPTKLSEYLISGVPVIVLAPKNIALSEFVSINNCGFCINTDNVSEIIHLLNEFIADISIQNIYSNNGKIVALNEFEINVVGKRFNRIFEN
ncbi:MAG: glycosyltransferase [Bacteroidales bacterium]|nr:glycosyltransferase [Bacteroidales bacterium]